MCVLGGMGMSFCLYVVLVPFGLVWSRDRSWSVKLWGQNKDVKPRGERKKSVCVFV